MTGLKPDWSKLPRTRIFTSTTSASGMPLIQEYDAIPLWDALDVHPHNQIMIHSTDGLSLLLSASDAARAYLYPLEDGTCQLLFPQDKHRKRFLKYANAFIADSE